jgi:hypothetical protein
MRLLLLFALVGVAAAQSCPSKVCTTGGAGVSRFAAGSGRGRRKPEDTRTRAARREGHLSPSTDFQTSCVPLRIQLPAHPRAFIHTPRARRVAKLRKLGEAEATAARRAPPIIAPAVYVSPRPKSINPRPPSPGPPPKQPAKERRLLQARLRRVQDVLVAQHPRLVRADGHLQRGRQVLRHHIREQFQGAAWQRDPLQVPHAAGFAGVPEPSVHYGRQGCEFSLLRFGWALKKKQEELSSRRPRPDTAKTIKKLKK